MCGYLQSPEAFWKIHNFFFEHQAELTRDKLHETLMQPNVIKDSLNPGASIAAWLMASQRRWWMEDVVLAVQQQIRVTPTVFVNGQRIEGVAKPEQIKTLIRQAVRSTEGKKN